MTSYPRKQVDDLVSALQQDTTKLNEEQYDALVVLAEALERYEDARSSEINFELDLGPQPGILEDDFN